MQTVVSACTPTMALDIAHIKNLLSTAHDGKQATVKNPMHRHHMHMNTSSDHLCEGHVETPQTQLCLCQTPSQL